MTKTTETKIKLTYADITQMLEEKLRAEGELAESDTLTEAKIEQENGFAVFVYIISQPKEV